MKSEKNVNNFKAKSSRVSKKKGSNTLIIGIIAVILLAGMAYFVLGGASSTSTKTDGTSKTNTDIKFPSYVYTNPITLKAYKYATESPEILEQIPCYCGCGGHSGHRFLRDCFIHDDRTYDEHASFCDICVGEASKVQDYLAKGKTLTEARALIDAEYGPKGDGTNTPPVRDDYIPILSGRAAVIPAIVRTPAKVDLSGMDLADNFKSLADGLNITPAGVKQAYFMNIKKIAGTEMENALLESRVEPDSFYGKKIIGMYSADFSTSSWIEMHDLGYDSRNDATLKGRTEPGMKNIVNTRPLLYGHSQNVDNVLKLMNDPESMSTSYSTFKPLLDSVDNNNVAYELVIESANKFSDINYMGITPTGENVELVKAYRITDNKSIPAGFSKYNPVTKANILIIKITGDLQTVQTESEKIDVVART
ncbi:MAG: hypothetical protein OIN87_12230 [Candidatus Methanoperedens sp.]|nr:hypothetical protein [Candidatus Methanoperedens sp.]